MKQFIITTTPTIEGHPIKTYLGAVNINLVIGTNFFSDFAASFTDVFGGNSATYQRKMDAMYENAKKELENKAKRIGGNAIVGFSTDFDEISGKGMSMFMLSATGTACRIENRNETISVEPGTTFVDADRLKQELDKEKLMNKLENASYLNLTEKDWVYLTDHPMKEAVKILMEKFYLVIEDEQKPKIEAILNLLDYNDASEIVYYIYNELPDGDQYSKDAAIYNVISSLMRRCMLFNPAATLQLQIKSPAKAVEILDCDKPYYNTEDLQIMKDILAKFSDLPDVGQISVGKNGMFSKEKELYICRHGHKNEKEYEFCGTCGENIKGLTRTHLKKIELFKVRVETLDKLLNHTI